MGLGGALGGLRTALRGCLAQQIQGRSKKGRQPAGVHLKERWWAESNGRTLHSGDGATGVGGSDCPLKHVREHDHHLHRQHKHERRQHPAIITPMAVQICHIHRAGDAEKALKNIYLTGRTDWWCRGVKQDEHSTQQGIQLIPRRACIW